jgi:uncharacterized protein (TIGR03437 family)
MSVRFVFLAAISAGYIGVAVAQSSDPLSVSASAQQVQLRWDEKVRIYVERKTSVGTYLPVGIGEDGTFTDTSIDPRETYSYRVSPLSGSGSPREATAGPPPSGFNVVAAAPNIGDDYQDFGQHPRLVLDQNGDPMIAYLFANPSGSGNYADSTIYFTAWNRSQGQFSKPVAVARTGDIRGAYANGDDQRIGFALARDASTNMLGIAYRSYAPNGTSSLVSVTFSTNGGQTWSNKTVTTDPADSYSNVDLALANGNVYLAFYHSNDGLRYVTGPETAAATTWRSVLAPTLSNATEYQPTFSLALDSSATLGMIYMLNSSNNVFIVYWQPSAGNTIQTVTTTNGFTSQDLDVKLSYSDKEPRVAFTAQRDNNYFADDDHTLWAAHAPDGRTWSVTNVPSDHGSGLGPPLHIASGSQGQVAIVTEYTGGDGTQTCGKPKLSLSNDFRSFTTCSPGGQGSADNPTFSANSPMVRYSNNDVMMISFQQPSAGNDLPYGVILWVQPQGSARPQINNGGIVIHGGISPNISPGSLVDIYGVNLASSPASADSSASRLPTTLANVQVTVNGTAAPLIYVGPSQIIFQVPYATAIGTASVVVTVNGIASPSAPMTVQQAAPSILTYNGNRAVVQNQDYTINTVSNPAKVGDVAIVYIIGSGPLSPAIATGAFAPNSPLSNETSTTKVTIGGVTAPLIFAGMAPGFAGPVQINFRVPTMNPGDYSLQVTIGTAQSNQPLISVGR